MLNSNEHLINLIEDFHFEEDLIKGKLIDICEIGFGDLSFMFYLMNLLPNAKFSGIEKFVKKEQSGLANCIIKQVSNKLSLDSNNQIKIFKLIENTCASEYVFSLFKLFTLFILEKSRSRFYEKSYFQRNLKLFYETNFKYDFQFEHNNLFDLVVLRKVLSKIDSQDRLSIVDKIHSILKSRGLFYLRINSCDNEETQNENLVSKTTIDYLKTKFSEIHHEVINREGENTYNDYLFRKKL